MFYLKHCSNTVVCHLRDKDKCCHLCCWLPALYQDEYHHTREKKRHCARWIATLWEGAVKLKTSTDRNTPSTLYCVPNHFSLRGHWPSCSGDSSIRLDFSGVRRDRAALITYTRHNHAQTDTQRHTYRRIKSTFQQVKRVNIFWVSKLLVYVRMIVAVNQRQKIWAEDIFITENVKPQLDLIFQCTIISSSQRLYQL